MRFIAFLTTSVWLGFACMPRADGAPAGLVVAARALTDHVRLGERFIVELRIENRNATAQSLNLERGSWPDRWHPDSLEVSMVGRDWDDDKAITVSLAPGATKTNRVELVIAGPTPNRQISFRMGFAQRPEPRDEGDDSANTLWSAPLSLEIVESPLQPITLGRALADFDHDGRIDELTLRWIGGRHFSDDDLWCGMGRKYTGKFAFHVAFANGRSVDTPLGRIWANADDDTWFRAPPAGRPFTLFTADYNHDGNIDFNLGQYASCNGSIFQICEVRPSGKIAALDTEGGVFSSGHEDSMDFDVTETGFIFSHYDNTRGSGVTYRADWDTKQRRFQMTEIAEAK